MRASLSLDEARRIALAAQGFAFPRPHGRVDRRHVRRVIDRMGLIQIDSVNVLVRSQELPLFARLGSHRRDAIPRATADGELFEYWGHEAAHIPTDRHRLWRWKMEGELKGGWRRAEQALRRRRGFVDRIYGHVADNGPTTAGDLRERVGKKGPWWDWDDAKLALELLFMTGRLTATRRATDFARLYDLPERVIPPQHLKAPSLDVVDAQRELMDLAARSLGVATAYDLADYYRLPLTDIKERIDELVEDDRLHPVSVQGWREVAYLHADAPQPRSIESRALLSMFDPVVWNRRRAERLFEFHYRIEIYTPV
ncbi:MAG: winged helix-turn-helix domain-containing protein, partial [Ilumatobacteraceae bacterium]